MFCKQAGHQAIPYPATLTTTLDQICTSGKCQFDVASVEPAGSVASRPSLILLVPHFEKHVQVHAQNCLIIYNMNMMTQMLQPRPDTCIYILNSNVFI